VAGGAGFIGSHIVDRLLKNDMEVTVLDNLYTGLLENIENCRGKREFRFVQGDVRDFDLVKSIVKNVDAVFKRARSLGYAPKFTLERGMRELVEWYSKRVS